MFWSYDNLQAENVYVGNYSTDNGCHTRDRMQTLRIKIDPVTCRVLFSRGATETSIGWTRSATHSTRNLDGISQAFRTGGDFINSAVGAGCRPQPQLKNRHLGRFHAASKTLGTDHPRASALTVYLK
jgi:hypothetical protein